MKKLLTGIFILVLTTGAFAQSYLPGSARAKELNEMYCSGLFSSQDGTYFDLESDEATSAISYLNILDWLQGRVAGLQVYQYRTIRVPFMRNQPAAVYLDEMRVDYGTINMLPVADIAMIKVMKSSMAGPWGAPGGAIAIYTKRGEETDEEEG